MRPEGYYDLRQGAAGFAPIVGALGALAVPAIVVLFTAKSPPADSAFVALAAGLLIVGMISSLTGAFAMAGIAAERALTANLPPAIIFAGVPVLVSMVSILGAFEVLARIYVAESKTIFVVITGIGGVAGVFFIALAVGDSWNSGPTNPLTRELWLPEQWIRSHSEAYRWATPISLISIAPIALGIGLRLGGLYWPPSRTGVNWIVLSGRLLAMVGTFLSFLRTTHPPNGVQRALRPWEAFSAPLALGIYTFTLMIFLP
jgi:hypothetical protein